MRIFVQKLFVNFLILFVFQSFLPTDTSAQNNQERFDEALELYQDGRFTDAALQFSEIDFPEARLFTGKSYFAAGKYKLSSHYLNQVPRNAPEEVYDDSRYTLALNDFQAGNFGRSLDRLYILSNDASSRSIRRSAESFYNQTMDYLTIEQRKEAFNQSNLPEVQQEIITASFNWVDRQTALTLISALEESLISFQDSARVADLYSQLNRANNQSQNGYAPAPDGITYNIGVALPDSEDENVLNISRSMYLGLSLAAEEFNRRNDNRKIALHYGNAEDEDNGPEHVMTNFIWNNNVDFVIGPLFSESAYRMTRLAEQYQTPLITPLANSDTLNIDNPYVYQVNPTFSRRGRAMARYAVNELGLNNLAIISERFTPAEQEAFAFRDEATRLGANFVHIFNENFVASGFDVSEITPWFAGDTLYVEDTEKYQLEPVDGLFLAAGSAGAANLIDLVITDLEAFRSDVTILGNEEMGNADISAQRLQRLDIYYPEIFKTNEDHEGAMTFRDDYNNLSGMEPNMFSFLGYDVANYMFKTLEDIQNPARLKESIKGRPSYNGLTVTIDFNNSHINRGARIFRLQPEGPIRVQ